MSEPERNKVVYVTPDSSQWVVMDVPFGMIMPPTVELHKPLVGPVVFYWAEGHSLPVPKEAKRK
jgi:hypothetical protein